MIEVRNGMQATDLADAAWRKSSRSGARGNCVELARLATGDVAVRNSRHPGGPALIYGRSQLAAFLTGLADIDGGETDQAAS
ncbi:MAG: DUF397 domain-containing protein [Pseudonocardiaceae bacterium]|nr:DUF397 domain-containing protein [Pseudonocardiaceae bacterium]